MMVKARRPENSTDGARYRDNLTEMKTSHQNPDAHQRSGIQTEKLSEAVGGILNSEKEDKSVLFPHDVVKGDDESNCSEIGDGVLDTKSSSRVLPKVYRSLSEYSNPQTAFEIEKESFSGAGCGVPVFQSVLCLRNNVNGNEESIHFGSENGDFDTKSSSRVPPKLGRSLSLNEEKNCSVDLTQKDHERPEGRSENFNFALKYKEEPTWTSKPEVVSKSKIRLSKKASCEQPVERELEPTIGRDNTIPEESLETCSDVGDVARVISGSAGSSIRNCPLLQTAKNPAYIEKYCQLKKTVKINHKQRFETDIDCTKDNSCFHPKMNHDWIKHDTKTVQIYNYAASRTGHLWVRERNSNVYRESGTCSHIGNGFVLTCYHCIEEILFSRFGWMYEQCLEQDLVVTFPEIGSEKLHHGSNVIKYAFEPTLFSHSEDLDYAVLRMNPSNWESLPPHYTNHTNTTLDKEIPVYIAGYQLHPDYYYGKFKTDARALKLPKKSINLDKVQNWSKKLKNNFQSNITKINNQKDPWHSTYYPVKQCERFIPVLSSLIQGASGGFGLTLHPEAEFKPVVNFMYRAGYPKFYYNSFLDNGSSSVCEDRLAIQNGFSPCWTFQEGVPIGKILDDVKNSPFESLKALQFLISNI